MAFEEYSIGDLARVGGCKVQTVRYYEKIGLLPAPPRSAGNQRLYDRVHMDRLAFIRHGRKLGFSLDAIRELLVLSDDPTQSCEWVDQIARGHLEEVEGRIKSLKALRSELRRMIDQCRGGKVGDCRIIEVLADHAPAGGR